MCPFLQYFLLDDLNGQCGAHFSIPLTSSLHPLLELFLTSTSSIVHLIFLLPYILTPEAKFSGGQ